MKYREFPLPREQRVLIPTTLDDLIPLDAPLRLFDELLDLMDWSVFERELRIEKRGQPPIHPRYPAAVLLFGLWRGVRSSRQLEYQLTVNLEFMWLTHGQRIDHSTLCQFRRRHREALKDLNRQLIQLCQKLGVVKLAEMYVDGTRVRADASSSKTMTAKKAAALLEQLDKQIQQRLEEMEQADALDEAFAAGEASGEELPPALRELQQRQDAIRKILEQCNEADQERRRQGTNPEENPFQLPLTDQDSRILPNKEGGYSANYTPIIGVEGGLGLIVSTTVINSPNEQDQLIAMVDEVEANYGVTVDTVGADAAFCIGTNIKHLEFDRGKNFLSPDRKGDVTADNPALRDDPTQPVAEEDVERLPLNPSTKRFDSEAFVYDEQQDVYYCPDGRTLHRVGEENNRQRSGAVVKSAIYQTKSCQGCPLIELCRKGTGHKNGRRVRRDEFEQYRRQHREKMSGDEAKTQYRKRFEFGERPFGSIKGNFGIRRFMTRGKANVDLEWSLASLTNNIGRLIIHFGTSAALRAALGTEN